VVVVLVSVGIGAAGCVMTALVSGGGERSTETHPATAKRAIGKYMERRMIHFPNHWNRATFGYGKKFQLLKVLFPALGN
jgi:hypothetical protein